MNHYSDLDHLVDSNKEDLFDLKEYLSLITDTAYLLQVVLLLLIQVVPLRVWFHSFVMMRRLGCLHGGEVLNNNNKLIEGVHVVMSVISHP